MNISHCMLCASHTMMYILFFMSGRLRFKWKPWLHMYWKPLLLDLMPTASVSWLKVPDISAQYCTFSSQHCAAVGVISGHTSVNKLEKSGFTNISVVKVFWEQAVIAQQFRPPHQHKLLGRDSGNLQTGHCFSNHMEKIHGEHPYNI